MSEQAELRALLHAERERTQARVATLESDLDALTRARRSESDDDEHDPEGVTLSAQWSLLGGILDAAREEAQQAEDAVLRLDACDYGVCALCQNPIPLAQLEVRPFREHCVACASRLERSAR